MRKRFIVRVKFTSRNGRFTSTETGEADSFYGSDHYAIIRAIWNAAYKHVAHGGSYDWSKEILSINIYTFGRAGKDRRRFRPKSSEKKNLDMEIESLKKRKREPKIETKEIRISEDLDKELKERFGNISYNEMIEKLLKSE